MKVIAQNEHNLHLVKFRFVSKIMSITRTSKLIAGRNITNENYSMLKNFADLLSVPLVRQTVDNVSQRYTYVFTTLMKNTRAKPIQVTHVI